MKLPCPCDLKSCVVALPALLWIKPFLPPLLFPSFLPQSPFLDSGVMARSWARVIPNNSERWQTFGFPLTGLLYMWTRPWHHGAKCLVSTLKFVLPFSVPSLVPTASAAAVRSPFFNETQDFLYFLLDRWWPYAWTTTSAIKVTGCELFSWDSLSVYSTVVR